LAGPQHDPQQVDPNVASSFGVSLLQAKSRHLHLGSLGRYVQLGEQTPLLRDAAKNSDLSAKPSLSQVNGISVGNFFSSTGTPAERNTARTGVGDNSKKREALKTRRICSHESNGLNQRKTAGCGTIACFAPIGSHGLGGRATRPFGIPVLGFA
jgi:hypothetical protein